MENIKKFALVFLVLPFIFAAGCDYDIPLIEIKGLPLEPSLIGVWEAPENQKEKIIISKRSQFEYSIRLLSQNDEGTFFLAYPIKVANILCLQLIATDEKYTLVNKTKKYLVISYENSGGNLIIKKLNTDIVSNELKSSIELRKAFLKNKDNKNLFTEIGKFKKVKSGVSTQANSDLKKTVPTIQGGILNGKARNLPLPEYPAAAKRAAVGGDVAIEVVVDEQGNVISAKSVAVIVCFKLPQ